MTDRRVEAVLEALASTEPSDDPASFRADLALVPAGASAATVAATCAVVRTALGSTGEFAVARLRAAVAGAEATAERADEPLLFVTGRFGGLFSRAFGTDDRRASPEQPETLTARTWQLAGHVAAARRRLLAAAGADEAAVLFAGGGRFLLLIGDSDETRARLKDARAEIERETLLRYEGEVVPTIAFISASVSALDEPRLLRAGLRDAERDRGRTPFLDALAAPDAMGPFGPAEMQADASFTEEFAREAEFGSRLRAARFAWGADPASGALEPCSDDEALARLAGSSSSGVAVWPGTRDGLRQLLAVAARVPGGFAIEPAPILPVSSAADESGPLAVVLVRLDDLAGHADRAAATFAEAMEMESRAHALMRDGAAGLAQGRAISILFGGDDEVLACGPLRAVLAFVQRLEERTRETFGESGPTLSAGLGVASRYLRRGTDVGRLARRAREAFRVARASGAGRTAGLSGVCPTRQVGRLLELGDDLVRLAAEAPGPTRALLETALRLGETGEALPLSAQERLRAKVHEIVAKLGVGARGNGREAADEGPRRALKTLVREFPAMFESGEARVPLAYAVLLSEDVET